MPAMSKIVLGVCAVEALNSKNLLRSRMQSYWDGMQSHNEFCDVSKVFHNLKITSSIPLDDNHPACDEISDHFKYYELQGENDAFFKGTPALTKFHEFTELHSQPAADTFSSIQSYSAEVLPNSDDTAIELMIGKAARVLQETAFEMWNSHVEEDTGVTVSVPQSSASAESLAAGKRLACMIEGMRAFNEKVVDELPDNRQAAKAFYQGLLDSIQNSLTEWRLA